jgi:hypothetical protein
VFANIESPLWPHRVRGAELADDAVPLKRTPHPLIYQLLQQGHPSQLHRRPIRAVGDHWILGLPRLHPNRLSRTVTSQIINHATRGKRFGQSWSEYPWHGSFNEIPHKLEQSLHIRDPSASLTPLPQRNLPNDENRGTKNDLNLQNDKKVQTRNQRTITTTQRTATTTKSYDEIPTNHDEKSTRKWNGNDANTTTRSSKSHPTANDRPHQRAVQKWWGNLRRVWKYLK